MTAKMVALGAALMLAWAGSAQAGEDELISTDSFPGSFSANVGLFTDYLFRGISQTDEGPAIQGGFDYSADLNDDVGFYTGVWASNLDFNDGNQASIEIDYYGGLTGEFGAIPGLTWDAGVIYYSYPGAAGSLNYDYVEGMFALGYDFGVASAGLSVNYSPDYFAGSNDGLYVAGSLDIPLPKGIGLSGHVGHQSIDANAVFGTPDYLDWKLGVTAKALGFGFELAYLDTDISDAKCFGGTNLCDARVVFSATRDF